MEIYFIWRLRRAVSCVLIFTGSVEESLFSESCFRIFGHSKIDLLFWTVYKTFICVIECACTCVVCFYCRDYCPVYFVLYCITIVLHITFLSFRIHICTFSINHNYRSIFFYWPSIELCDIVNDPQVASGVANTFKYFINGSA